MARLMWLPDVLRAAALDVVTVPGWELRGSSTLDPRVIVNHHTAARSKTDAPSLNICINGRPGVVGPLCNLLIARSGRIHVIASGRSNNAGLGGWAPVRATGNAHTIGIEVENDGVGEPWSDHLMDVLVRANAAICTRLSWDASRCIGHKEWAPTRKIDPTFNMNVFRARVADLIEEDGMSAQTEREIHELWTAFIGHEPREGGIHNLAYPILSTNHGVSLLLAAANKGTDPDAIARAVIAELGEDMARQLVRAMGAALSGDSPT